MGDHKAVECKGFAEWPRLVIPLFVDLVEVSHDRCIHKSDSDGPANVKHGVVDIGADGEWMRKGAI